jgi:hypothetical protein
MATELVNLAKPLPIQSFGAGQITPNIPGSCSDLRRGKNGNAQTHHFCHPRFTVRRDLQYGLFGRRFEPGPDLGSRGPQSDAPGAATLRQRDRQLRVGAEGIPAKSRPGLSLEDPGDARRRYEIEFENGGEAELFFVAIRPGTYEYGSKGMMERGVVGKIIVESGDGTAAESSKKGG